MHSIRRADRQRRPEIADRDRAEIKSSVSVAPQGVGWRCQEMTVAENPASFPLDERDEIGMKRHRALDFLFAHDPSGQA